MEAGEVMVQFTMESLDLCRRINEFSRIRRLLLFVILGKYAGNELVIMRDNIEKEGYDTTWDYNCEDCTYNNERLKW